MSAEAKKTVEVHKGMPQFEGETLYLVPKDEVEVCAAWCEANRPDILDHNQLITELHLNELRQDTTIFVLARKPARRGGKIKPMLPFETVNGERLHRQADPKDLIDEVVLSAPVHASVGWEPNTGGRGLRGRMHVEKVHLAIAEQIGTGYPFELKCPDVAVGNILTLL